MSGYLQGAHAAQTAPKGPRSQRGSEGAVVAADLPPRAGGGFEKRPQDHRPEGHVLSRESIRGPNGNSKGPLRPQAVTYREVLSVAYIAYYAKAMPVGRAAGRSGGARGRGELRGS